MIPLYVTVPASGALAVVAGVLTVHGGPPASVGTGIQAGPVRVTLAPGTTRSTRVTVMDTGSGTGIQAGPVRVTLAPGTTRSTSVTVMDTGSGTETLAVRAYQLDPRRHPVPGSWVRAASVTLAAGTEGTSAVTVTVPAGTAPGRYRGDLMAGDLMASASPGSPGGLSFGAAAFTNLVITVTPSAPSSH